MMINLYYNIAHFPILMKYASVMVAKYVYTQSLLQVNTHISVLNNTFGYHTHL